MHQVILNGDEALRLLVAAMSAQRFALKQWRQQHQNVVLVEEPRRNGERQLWKLLGLHIMKYDLLLKRQPATA